MSPHEKTWETYVASWRTRSIEDKRALLEASLAADCSYADPRAQPKGLQHAHGADLEIYGPEYAPGSDTSVMYYAIPIAADAPGER